MVTSGIVQVGEHAKAEEADHAGAEADRKDTLHPPALHFERLANFVRGAFHGYGMR